MAQIKFSGLREHILQPKQRKVFYSAIMESEDLEITVVELWCGWVSALMSPLAQVNSFPIQA